MNEKISTDNQIEEIGAKALALPERYRGLTVRNNADLEQANGALLHVKQVLARANGLVRR